MANEDEGIPESVQAEVDAIKRQEGIEPKTSDDGKWTEETEAVAAPAADKPKGRRAQLEEERNNLLRAAEERAAKAEAAVADVRREAAERHARLEGLIEAGNQHRQQPVYIQQPPQQQAPPRDYQAERRASLREAQKALAAGDYDGWQEHQDKATSLLIQSEKVQWTQEIEQRMPRQQPQNIEKPIWLTAVENQFHDVLQHQRGPGTVAAFMQMEGIGPGNFNAENMQKAFVRARKELGTSNGTAGPTEQQRQVHAGGPVNGSSRPSVSNGGGKKVDVPKNWKRIAADARISEADYLRAARKMQNGE